MQPRIFILALDGVPFTFLQKAIRLGLMPNLAMLVEKSDFRQMDSVIPPVSSSAWASFMTGKSPGEHGIMGFVDRDPATMEWYIPLADRLKAKTLWEILSENGKRIFVMNVPLTYPPPKVNGISICGFLGSDITKGTYPPEIGTLLKARGYIIDADTELAKQDLYKFYTHLHEVLDKRVETMWHFWRQEEWDFFMTHIMETDRLHHFFWEYMENDHEKFAPLFYDFYAKIDCIIGEVVKKIPDKIELMLLSDHGFTTLKKEVYINRWLWEKGWLRFNKQHPQSLTDIQPQSKAYSLYPGRIYVNLKGREKSGSVQPGIEYEQTLNHLSASLLKIDDPETGKSVIQKVIRGEEAYSVRDKIIDMETGKHETTGEIPDLIALSYEGYDLKGDLWRNNIFEKTYFNGMHTFNDAFVLSRGRLIPPDRISITGLLPVILDYFGITSWHSS